MPHFQKIGIYANNGTSHVRSAITKLEASLDDFGCGVFFEKTSSTSRIQIVLILRQQAGSHLERKMTGSSCAAAPQEPEVSRCCDARL